MASRGTVVDAYPGIKPGRARTKKEKEMRTDARNGDDEGGKKDEALACLREFDLDSRFGPCMGLTRIERWERAEKLGLDPPPRVKALLESRTYCAYQDCIWEGRV